MGGEPRVATGAGEMGGEPIEAAGIRGDVWGARRGSWDQAGWVGRQRGQGRCVRILERQWGLEGWVGRPGRQWEPGRMGMELGEAAGIAGWVGRPRRTEEMCGEPGEAVGAGGWVGRQQGPGAPKSTFTQDTIFPKAGPCTGGRGENLHHACGDCLGWHCRTSLWNC